MLQKNFSNPLIRYCACEWLLHLLVLFDLFSRDHLCFKEQFVENGASGCVSSLGHSLMECQLW